MTARVLVVDDVPANVRVLEAKLSAEYFETMTATSGREALALIERDRPDIVLLDIVMPHMDGVEVCRRIKNNPHTHHIPVIMVSALDQRVDRLRALSAGADDFLTKPVDDLALFSRLRNLVRLKFLTDDLKARASIGGLGLPEAEGWNAVNGLDGDILLVDGCGSLTASIGDNLSARHRVQVCHTMSEAMSMAGAGMAELVIIDLDQRNLDGLRICSRLRSLNETRQLPLLVTTSQDARQRLMRALEMGVNDYLLKPVDPTELITRVDAQLRRWRYAESLRKNVRRSIEMALTDELTGLFNRRYLDTHLDDIIEKSMHRAQPVSVLAIDLDYFKTVNDTFGHAVGDDVLRECGARLRAALRSSDLACRIGGEEFLIILPSTPEHVASRIAERLRHAMCNFPFLVGNVQTPLTITISIGVAGMASPVDTAGDLLRRADIALYEAKRTGRDKVTRSTLVADSNGGAEHSGDVFAGRA